jgi:hypothetical protein
LNYRTGSDVITHSYEIVHIQHILTHSHKVVINNYAQKNHLFENRTKLIGVLRIIVSLYGFRQPISKINNKKKNKTKNIVKMADSGKPNRFYEKQSEHQ